LQRRKIFNSYKVAKKISTFFTDIFLVLFFTSRTGFTYIIAKNPFLISKRLFSTALNDKGYSYCSYDPISLQILKLESHGSQLSEAKNRNFLSCPDQVLLQGEYEKVFKKSKNVCTLSDTLHVFANISGTSSDILKI
jgi:hypothetical protein